MKPAPTLAEMIASFKRPDSNTIRAVSLLVYLYKIFGTFIFGTYRHKSDRPQTGLGAIHHT